MATILQFPRTKLAPVTGLTKPECDAILMAGEALIEKGLASFVSLLDGGRYACVFDSQEKTYHVGQEDGVFYLLDPNNLVVTSSPQFEHVLQALEMTLNYHPDIPA